MADAGHLMTRIAREWPGRTVACIATGPSLVAEDVERLRGLRTIAINDAYKLAPWADVLYACDSKWWGWHKGVPEFAGRKFALEPPADARSRKLMETLKHFPRPHWAYPDVARLKGTGRFGLELEPDGLRLGSNSGYQAINLAVHFGAARILLLGYDMQGDHRHFFGVHPDQSKPPFRLCLEAFETLVAPLKELGVEVINCTRRTALHCFPEMSLEDALRKAA